MRKTLLATAALALLTGAAFAQEAGNPAPPPIDNAAAPADAGMAPPPPPPGGPRGEERDGPRGPRGPGPREGRGPGPDKAGHIRVDLGEGRGIDVKCPEDEPMKACADIANAFLDRVAPRT